MTSLESQVARGLWGHGSKELGEGGFGKLSKMLPNDLAVPVHDEGERKAGTQSLTHLGQASLRHDDRAVANLMMSEGRGGQCCLIGVERNADNRDPTLGVRGLE